MEERYASVIEDKYNSLEKIAQERRMTTDFRMNCMFCFVFGVKKAMWWKAESLVDMLHVNAALHCLGSQ